jgi:bifunctional UDP-N-acetylglucosamine pyrophosphorylase/glucosamine-1-phosphate N-acetyltransferase
MRERINLALMLSGVTMVDPLATYVDSGVTVGRDTVILPGTRLLGTTSIGERCEIGPQSVVRDSVIADNVRVTASYVEQAKVAQDVTIGPFSHLRPGAVIESGVHIGNYAEVKNSRVGAGTHIGHFSYVGDSTLGADVNIGAGTVTANYDGEQKHSTEIGAGASIGSGTMIVAPVSIGAKARTGAGSVVTHDIAPGETVAGVPARPMKKKPAPKRGLK